MNRITAGLQSGSQGAEVANLQDGLLLLLDRRVLDLPDADADQLAGGLKRERRTSTFSDVTAKVIGLFRERRGLPPADALVDEATAKALNTALAELGAFDPDPRPVDPVDPPSPTRRTLTGAVALDVGAAASGVSLRLYRREFGGSATVVAEATTQTDGSYRLDYDPGAQGWSVELRAVGADGTETTVSGPLDRTATASSARVDLIVPAALAPTDPEYRRLVTDLTPLVGDQTVLAKARESDGRRDITGLATATGWDARLAALAANAERVGAETGLAPEALYGLYRAGLPTEANALATLAPETVKGALTRLRGAGIVGLDDGAVTEFVTRFEEFSGTARLATTAPGSSASYGELLDAAVTGADRTAFARVFFDQTDRTRTESDVWDAARQAGVAEPAIARLRWQGKLAYLAGNSAPVTKALMNDLSDGPPGAQQKLSSPAALVDAGLYRAQTWREKVEALAGDDDELGALIPVGFAGDTPQERLDAYSEDLARKVRLSYPTKVVTHMIDAGDLPVGPDAPATVRLLSQAAEQGFELGRQPMSAFLKTADRVVTGLTDDELTAATTTVKTLHRVYQITPSNDSMAVLLDLGLTSAYDVTSLSFVEFDLRFAGAYLDRFGRRPTRAETRLVWRKAHQVSAMTYNLFGVVKRVGSDPGVLAISGSASARAAAVGGLKGALTDYPTMESLFGPLDFCECEHCHSVLGPAAYLADLLGFAEGESAAWANFLLDWKQRNGTDYTARYRNPYEALVARRPDLAHLSLDCANTNTELPYIDLVNEVLEYHVAHGALAAAAAHDTGDTPTEALLAEPAHVLTAAYRTLAQARYPIGLPFDLWTRTVAAFTEHAEVPLAELLDLFRPTESLVDEAVGYDRTTVFAQQLGIDPPELALLTDPDPLSDWWTLYGYPDAATATTPATDPDTGQRLDLNSAKALSRRLGVTYRELVTLVQTAFVNPTLARTAVLSKLPAAMSTVRWFLDAANTAFLAANADLLGEALNPAQSARKQALSADDWNRLTDLAAFAERVAGYADTYGLTPDQARAELAAIPADRLLVLADTDTGSSFDATTLRFADGSPADAATFVRLSWFVRVWRRLGWSLAEVDTALARFTPTDADGFPVLADRPLRTALTYLAHLVTLADRLGVADSARPRLLTLWGPLPTTGPKSAYAQLFLTRKVLGTDPVFDHPHGDYLAPGWVAAQAVGKPPEFALIRGHLPAIQAALGLTAVEVASILARSGASIDTAGLTLDNVSTLARHAILAKALRLKAAELSSLVELSGLDPFRPLAADPLDDLADDVPLTETLALVERAQALRDRGLTVADVEFLLRRRFDPVGPYRGDPGTTDALLVGLADQLRAAASAAVAPSDPAALTEQVLSDLLGTGLESTDVARTLTLLRGGQDPTSADRDFFDTVLRLRDVGAGATTGFLDETDYPGLFAPPAGLVEILATDTREEAEAKRAANEAVVAAEATRRRSRVASAFTAAALARRSTETVSSVLARSLDLDPTTAAGLLADPILLGEAGTPLAATMRSLASAGLDAALFAAPDGTGARLDAPALVGDPGDPSLPAAGSARFDGYLVVARTGPHRFTVALGQAGATAELRLDGGAQAHVLSGVAAADGEVLGSGPDGLVQLTAGVPYRLRLTADQLGGAGLQVRVHSAAVPEAPLSALALYPASALTSARTGWERLRSAAVLVDRLGLSLREVRHLVGHPAQFGLALTDLPTQPVGDDPADLDAAQARFAGLLRWAGYVALRDEIAGGSADLVEVLAASEEPLPVVLGRLAELLRREPAELTAAARALWPSTDPVLDSVEPVRRLWQGLTLATRFGTTADRLRDWTRVVSRTEDDAVRVAMAVDVRETVRAMYDTTTWQWVVRPISDALRAAQRDALVAHVRHAEGLERTEQLYELLLLDPLMEPVVTTSRIRAAIGSVQLFLTRVLLSLEREVHPSALMNADQWEWMKRYRVWEANRRIWLFPENWLEPEFRGDKSHLFTELEGKLLSNDVSPDLVEDAFTEYLRKLEELARLDIVAMHLEDDVDFTRNTLHVIGRTFALPHKYFYRRYANRLWSAWEPVDVAVEGDHVMPVVWRDRLFLFWVTFLEQGQASGSGSVDTSKTIPLPTVVRTAEAQLHFSQLIDGSWSTPQTVGYGVPDDLKLRATLPAGFTTASVPVWVSVFPDPSAGQENATNLAQAGVYLNLGAPFDQAFHLASRTGTPEPAPTRPRPDTPFVVGTDATKVRPTRRIGTSGRLSVSLRTRISSEPSPDLPVTLDVLGSTPQFSLLPVNNLITLAVPEEAYADADNPAAVQAALTAGVAEIENLMKPAFYADHSTTLFVEPQVTERTLEEWEQWVTTTPVPDTGRPDWLEDDRWWREAIKPRYPKKIVVGPGGPLVDPVEVIVDHGAPYSVIPVVAGQDWLTNGSTGLVFDGEVLGAAGSIGAHLIEANAGRASRDQLGAHAGRASRDQIVPVAAGSQIAAGQALVVRSSAHVGTAVTLVGSAGLNAAVHGVTAVHGLTAMSGPLSTGIFAVNQEH